jgi:hypothetical protein
MRMRSIIVAHLLEILENCGEVDSVAISVVIECILHDLPVFGNLRRTLT